MKVFTFCGGSCGPLQARQLAGLQGGEHAFPGAALRRGLLLSQLLGGLQLLDGLLAGGLYLLRFSVLEVARLREGIDLCLQDTAKLSR